MLNRHSPRSAPAAPAIPGAPVHLSGTRTSAPEPPASLWQASGDRSPAGYLHRLAAPGGPSCTHPPTPASSVTLLFEHKPRCGPDRLRPRPASPPLTSRWRSEKLHPGLIGPHTTEEVTPFPRPPEPCSAHFHLPAAPALALHLRGGLQVTKLKRGNSGPPWNTGVASAQPVGMGGNSPRKKATSWPSSPAGQTCELAVRLFFCRPTNRPPAVSIWPALQSAGRSFQEREQSHRSSSTQRSEPKTKD